MKTEYLIQVGIVFVALVVFYFVFLQPVTKDIKDIAEFVNKIK
jgi:preprotein translocase subunit YajC